jgi:hypothetical protein
MVVAFFVLIYAPTMQRERANIAGRFPAEYETYAANVPAFMPRPTAWRGAGADGPEADAGGFSLDLYMKHGEWKAGLTFLLVMGWLTWRTVTGP